MSKKQDVPGSEATSGVSPYADPSTTRLPPEVQDLIGRQLRRVYSGLVEERIPDNFTSLLDRLSASSVTDASARHKTEQDT